MEEAKLRRGEVPCGLLSSGYKGAIRSVWGIHIPYIFPIKRGAKELLEFPNHLVLGSAS